MAGSWQCKRPNHLRCLSLPTEYELQGEQTHRIGLRKGHLSLAGTLCSITTAVASKDCCEESIRSSSMGYFLFWEYYILQTPSSSSRRASFQKMHVMSKILRGPSGRSSGFRRRATGRPPAASTRNPMRFPHQQQQLTGPQLSFPTKVRLSAWPILQSSLMPLDG